MCDCGGLNSEVVIAKDKMAIASFKAFNLIACLHAFVGLA